MPEPWRLPRAQVIDAALDLQLTTAHLLADGIAVLQHEIHGVEDVQLHCLHRFTRFLGKRKTGTPQKRLENALNKYQQVIRQKTKKNRDISTGWAPRFPTAEPHNPHSLAGDLICGGVPAALTFGLRHHGAQLVQQDVQGVVGSLLLRKIGRSGSLESSAVGVAQHKDQPSVQSPGAEFQAPQSRAFSMSASFSSLIVGQNLNL